MKKLHLLKLAVVAVMAFLSLPSLQAQDDDGSHFGIRAGVLASKQDVEGGTVNEDPESKLGADFAAILNFPLGGGTFDFQPEVHWLQKGYKIKDAQTVGDVTSTLNYVEIPLLLRFNLGGGARIFAFAGPSIGFFVGGKYEDDLGSHDLDSDEVEGTEWSAHVGAGIGIWILELDIRYMQGLSDVSTVAEAKNSGFGAGLTLMF